jgi:hypothetical protein
MAVVMRKNRIFTDITLIGMLILTVSGILTGGGIGDLSDKQKLRLLKDVVRKEPFMKSSSDVKIKKFTLGKFFNMSIYKKLEGNDILGYQFDQGFQPASGGVLLKSVRTTGKTTRYKQIFISALRTVGVRRKVGFSRNGGTEIGVGLIDAEEFLTDKTLPGALVEVYFRNRGTGKYFYYRFGTGKRQGLKEAFEDIWDIIFSVLDSFR